MSDDQMKRAAKFVIPGGAISNLVFQCGANVCNTEFSDAVAWVGDLQNDDGTTIHGLHAYSTEYPEDGSITLAEFPPPAEITLRAQVKALSEALSGLLAKYDAYDDLLPADHPIVAARAALRTVEVSKP